MSGDLMIEARGLGRSFRLGNQTVTAVRSVDLAVAEGELVAFLGPNGAGKTTTLRMLTTLLPPTAGTARIAGADIRTEPERARAAIGYVGQKPAAGETYRVRDELVTQGRCHGLDTRRSRQRADELLDLLELTALADRTPATLSGGQRRRADIALGLMHRPRLLFLDEPSTGLDPRSRAHIWEQILRLRAEHGITIFLTTHYLDEAERMAERVIIVDQGRVIADGTARELKSALAGDRIRITTDTAEQAGAAAGIAARFTTPDLVSTDGLALTLQLTDADAHLPRYLREFDHAGVRVATAESSRPTLDDVFLTLTGRRLHGNLFWMVTQLLLFPLTLLSGVLLPISAGPGWLRALAAVNPVAYVVDAARALFAGQFLAAAVLPGVAAVAVITAAGLGLATRALRRGV